VIPAPQRTSTPGPAPSATPQAGGPSPTATAGGQPTPAPSASPADQRTVTVAVQGFADGAACAVAARAAASEDPWRTGPLTPVDASGDPVTFTFAPNVARPFDAALLCFDEAPAAVPPELATLADANPTVVFVLPE
jgi:hypothetical protein